MNIESFKDGREVIIRLTESEILAERVKELYNRAMTEAIKLMVRQQYPIMRLMIDEIMHNPETRQLIETEIKTSIARMVEKSIEEMR